MGRYFIYFIGMFFFGGLFSAAAQEKIRVNLAQPVVYKPYKLNEEGHDILSVKAAQKLPVATQANSFESLKNGPFLPNMKPGVPTTFFCLQEYKLEKMTSLRLRFRLGSLAYTDYLEQKLNALKP